MKTNNLIINNIIICAALAFAFVLFLDTVCTGAQYVIGGATQPFPFARGNYYFGLVFFFLNNLSVNYPNTQCLI